MNKQLQNDNCFFTKKDKKVCLRDKPGYGALMSKEEIIYSSFQLHAHWGHNEKIAPF